MNTDSFEDQLSLAKLQLYARDKYLYNIVSRISVVEGLTLPDDPEVPGYTNGATIFLTEAWRNAEELMRLEVVVHEVLHIALFHMKRIRAIPKEANINFRLMHIAADLAIIPPQVSLGISPHIKAFFPNWREYDGLSMEEIYSLLMPDDGKGYSPGHMDIALPGGSGEADDGGLDPSIPEPTAEEEHAVEAAVQQAAQIAQREGYSTAVSTASARAVDLMRAKKIPWQFYLQKIVSRLKSQDITWARPNRRLHSQAYLPSRKPKDDFIATMAVDVSGSVGQEALNRFMSIAADLITRYVATLHLMTFDDKIVDEWQLNRRNKISELQLNGFGGTRVEKVYEHLIETKSKPKLLVIATDGYIGTPADPGYPVVWLITENRNFKADYGTIIQIDED